MPLHSRIQSLFDEFDAKVEQKLGLNQRGGGGGYMHQHAIPYNTPTGQYAGPGAQSGWPQQQHNSYAGPSSQWQQPQQGSNLTVPQGRPRGNSSPGARDRDNDGIPYDAPPTYEEASGSTKKETPRPEKNSALPGDHWAPTNPFRDPGASSSSQPKDTPSQAPPSQQGQQFPPQTHQASQPRPQLQPPLINHIPPFGQQGQQAPPPQQSNIQPMFPLTFDMWYNTTYESDKTELHIAGQPPNNPAFVATFSLGWKGKTELHERSARGPILMSAKSSNTSGTKQNMIFPDGSTLELKTPDLRKYYFITPTGPNGLPEKFRWKKAKGGDMREISPIYMGWKLTVEGTDEVVAVFGENVGWKNGVGEGKFAFVGSGRTGVRGAHWANVVVFSFVKVSHDKFVEGIAGGVAGGF